MSCFGVSVADEWETADVDENECSNGFGSRSKFDRGGGLGALWTVLGGWAACSCCVCAGWLKPFVVVANDGGEVERLVGAVGEVMKCHSFRSRKLLRQSFCKIIYAVWRQWFGDVGGKLG